MDPRSIFATDATDETPYRKFVVNRYTTAPVVSHEQLREIIQCSTSPVYFAKNYVKLQHPTKGIIPMPVWPQQKTLLEEFHKHPHVIVNASRQSGKTTTGSTHILWYSAFHSDQTVLVTSWSHDGAREMLDRIRLAYELLPHWLKPQLKVNNKNEMKFDNGSRIIARAATPTSARGMSISLWYADEFSMVKSSIQDEFYNSVFPSFCTGSKAIISSTPSGKDDMFSALWASAMNGVGCACSFVPIEIREV